MKNRKKYDDGGEAWNEKEAKSIPGQMHGERQEGNGRMKDDKHSEGKAKERKNGRRGNI